jgi:hypothetical protein
MMVTLATLSSMIVPSTSLLYGELPLSCTHEELQHKLFSDDFSVWILLTFMTCAAWMNAEEKSNPTTSSKSSANAKTEPPTAQPMSSARPLFDAACAHCLPHSCGHTHCKRAYASLFVLLFLQSSGNTNCSNEQQQLTAGNWTTSSERKGPTKGASSAFDA